MDFEIGQRHDLPVLQVIGFDGKMTDEVATGFSGLEALVARDRILSELKANEYLKGEDEYTHSVGHCYKCGTIIQPLVKDQWFLKIRPLAERAREAIEKGEVTFTPASKGKLVAQYLDNLRDWNLSRQIPWGIPIPAFRNANDHNDWIFDTRVDQETLVIDGKTYHREEDTFDTWFSSGQWPFITTDYLTKGELSRFYPNDVMETGHDLLDRWVARMIMLGLYMTDQVPFKHVYMHGMVLDERGQKMSKSKGNVINPMESIDEYGSDALRMGIVSNRSAGQNQAFSSAKVLAGRNFCNKLWNIARYIEGVVEDAEDRTPHPETPADHWVIRQLLAARDSIDDNMAKYRFAEAADTVYHTIWDDVADWYVEASKQHTGEGMLAWVLETCLKLAHPFAPFVTETIWTTLKWDSTLLIRSEWPQDVEFHELSAAEFEQIKALVIEARYVASELPGGKQKLVYEHDTLIADNAALIMRLAKLASVDHTEQPIGLRLAVANREAWLDIDADTLYEHQSKLELRLVHCREQVKRLEERLSNDRYVSSAPDAVVQQTRDQLKEQKSLEEKLVTELQSIEL